MMKEQHMVAPKQLHVEAFPIRELAVNMGVPDLEDRLGQAGIALLTDEGQRYVGIEDLWRFLGRAVHRTDSGADIERSGRQGELAPDPLAGWAEPIQRRLKTRPTAIGLYSDFE